MDRLLRETRTLISCGGFQFAHLAEALKIKSMNLRADSGAMIAEAYGSIRGSWNAAIPEGISGVCIYFVISDQMSESWRLKL